ncbi:unnamed protein product [Paramecium sonneborni]|uniref:Transmembrane protein n=1 Tax=Paramecium sonneborni TaxID=65129 RepID=A0A8S1QV77_9CILI|nr:unnamed protein product [Paramecium sonneborni]
MWAFHNFLINIFQIFQSRLYYDYIKQSILNPYANCLDVFQVQMACLQKSKLKVDVGWKKGLIEIISLILLAGLCALEKFSRQLHNNRQSKHFSHFFILISSFVFYIEITIIFFVMLQEPRNDSQKVLIQDFFDLKKKSEQKSLVF